MLWQGLLNWDFADENVTLGSFEYNQHVSRYTVKSSSFSTEHLASKYCAKTIAGWDKKHLSLGIYCVLF